MPPLVSFTLGSLGFMTPFHLDTMPNVLSSVRVQWACCTPTLRSAQSVRPVCTSSETQCLLPKRGSV